MPHDECEVFIGDVGGAARAKPEAPALASKARSSGLPDSFLNLHQADTRHYIYLVNRLFRTCRGKHLFSYLVLPYHNAMRENDSVRDLPKKQEELFCSP